MRDNDELLGGEPIRIEAVDDDERQFGKKRPVLLRHGDVHEPAPKMLDRDAKRASALDRLTSISEDVGGCALGTKRGRRWQPKNVPYSVAAGSGVYRRSNSVRLKEVFRSISESGQQVSSCREVKCVFRKRQIPGNSADLWECCHDRGREELLVPMAFRCRQQRQRRAEAA